MRERERERHRWGRGAPTGEREQKRKGEREKGEKERMRKGERERYRACGKRWEKERGPPTGKRVRGEEENGEK